MTEAIAIVTSVIFDVKNLAVGDRRGKVGKVGKRIKSFYIKNWSIK